MAGVVPGRDGYRPKTFARYLKLCSQVAGLGDEPLFEDVLGHMSFLVATGRVPAAADWVEGIATTEINEHNEAFAEGFF